MPSARYLFPIAIVAIAASPVAAQKVGSTGYQLLKAVKENDVGAFYQIMRESGSKLNAAVLDYSDGNETALHAAVRANRRDFVNDLLYYGANPNLIGGDGETPLTMAIATRNSELTDLLLRGGAQIDFANKRGETPLVKAVRTGDLGLVQLLLQKGASPDKRDFSGRSAREYAAIDTRNPAIARAIESAPKTVKRPVAGPKLN